MKKLCGLFAMLIIFSALMTGCSSTSDASTKELGTAAIEAEESLSSNRESGTSFGEDSTEIAQEDTSEMTEIVTAIDTDKIIYSSYAQVESLDFDESINQVNSLIAEYGGFVENSSVTGTTNADNHYNNSSYRFASFTLRIPKDSFSSLEEGLSKLGNVVEYTTQAENVTSQYTDLEARLASYETQRGRLMTMLEQAESVEDMITIDSRLSDVTYQIESLTATMNNLENQINYSTLAVNITEVSTLTETENVGYWTDVASTLSASLSCIGAFFKAALKYLIAAIPVIVILAVILIVVLCIRRRLIRRRSEILQQSSSDSISEDNPDDESDD